MDKTMLLTLSYCEHVYACLPLIDLLNKLSEIEQGLLESIDKNEKLGESGLNL